MDGQTTAQPNQLGQQLTRILPRAFAPKTAGDTVFPFANPWETAPAYVLGPTGSKLYQINPRYFATEECADWLAARYGAAFVSYENGVALGTGVSQSMTDRELNFPNGKVIAGLLAEIFIDYPSFSYADGVCQQITNKLKGLA